MKERSMEDIPALKPIVTMQRGIAALRDGRHDEALSAFLWCWDEGEAQVPAFSAVKVSFVAGFLGELSENYAPARRELNARIEKLQDLRDAGSAERDQLRDLAALEGVLRDGAGGTD